MTIQPNPAVDRPPYSIRRSPVPMDLFLDGNEGAQLPDELLDALTESGVELLRRYPKTADLEAKLAERFGLGPERVIVTAGADDALDRLCRALLPGGRELIFPVPGFEMLRRYAETSGGVVRTVDWLTGPYPTEAVLELVNETTRIVAVTSPQNPTGAVAELADFRRLAQALPHCLVLADLAYVEFADADPTAELLDLDNVCVLRTFSKAWGLAGCRVGYALGAARVIDWMRTAGAPYAVAGPSVALAERWLETGEPVMRAFVDSVRAQRDELTKVLGGLGVEVLPSQANFLMLRAPDAPWLRDAMAGLGIAIRCFPGQPELEGCVRIAMPGTDGAYRRLRDALHTALAPQAVLLDMDGVFADEGPSYRQAIVETCGRFGLAVTLEEVAAFKALGDANNDWVATHRLLASRGISVDFEEVKGVFEELYQGGPEQAGLHLKEGLIPPREQVRALAERIPVAIVTGRPRPDMERFLERFEIEGLFAATVCLAEAGTKPSPEPVRRALELLGVERAWMVGDTPDDVRAARGAGVLPLGICAPGEESQETRDILTKSGAARVLDRFADIEELLP